MKILSEKLTKKEITDEGLAGLIYDGIVDEWETIKFYDSVIGVAKNQNRDDIVRVIEDIKTEENRHVGQLQQLLETVQRNIKPIKLGETEAKGQIKK